MSRSDEKTFQNEMIASLTANGWQLGDPKNYNRELALYEEDVIAFVQESQPQQWRKYKKTYGDKAEKRLIERERSRAREAMKLGGVPEQSEEARVGA